MLVPPFASKNFYFPKTLFGVYKSYVSNKIEESRRTHVFLANKLFMIILIVIIVAIIKALFFTDFNLSVTKDKGKTKKTNPPHPPPRHMPGGSGGGFSKRLL